MNPDTLKRIRAQAEEDARTTVAYADFAVLDVQEFADAIRKAYLRGADAGYTASKAEGREP